MANITRNFTAGKMNKMVDERLVPNGEYIDALNVRMGSSEGSEIGAIENSKGNTVLTDLKFLDQGLSNGARCIGAFEDGAEETLYWFVNDPSFTGTGAPAGIVDLVVSFNTNLEILTYHIISVGDPLDATKTVLNFDSQFLITGVNKIEDLLFWTDNYNQPRQINVTTNYPNPVSGVDVLSAESLLVIKKPPVTSPTIKPIATSSQDNFLEDRMISFAYRYKYADGQYSATSQFSGPAFIPNTFRYDPTTALNSGMLNSANMCDVTYNAGGPLVVGVDLLFKDMNSSIIKIIEKLDKVEEGLSDNTNYIYTFTNSKIFTILADSEILRLNDNVPLLAQSQTMMGNRVMYGNYLEGYDLVRDKVKTKLEYGLTVTNKIIGRESIEGVLDSGNYTWDGNVNITDSIVDIDLTDQNLIQGASLNILIRFEHSQFTSGPPTPSDTTQETTIDFTYILLQDFATVYDLATSTDFSEKIGVVGQILAPQAACSGTSLTDLFNCQVPNELSGFFKYESGISGAAQPIAIFASPSSNIFSLQLPAVRYVDNLVTPVNNVFEYYAINIVDIVFQDIGNPSSLHSNRGYEIGIIYMDEFLRSTTALVSLNNTAHIPCSASGTQNKINVTIPTTQIAPEWATRYKFCIKADKAEFNTIYSQFFFRDPASGADYFLLDGQNSQKIQEGDEMIVKADTNGPRPNCTFTTVLEKKPQLKNFLGDDLPLDDGGNEIQIPSGVYMKLQANNFSTVVGDNPVIDYGEKSSTGGGCRTVRYPVDVENAAAPGTYIDYTIPSGSRIAIRISNIRKGNESAFLGNVPRKEWIVESDFIVPQDYTNFKAWFDGNNISQVLEVQANDAGTNVDGPNYSATTQNLDNRPCNTTNVYTNFDTSTGRTCFGVKSSEGYGGGNKKTRLEVEIVVVRANGLLVFESTPADTVPDLWFESSESYSINQSNGEHSGNIQNQVFSSNTPAIIQTAFENCFTFGNGVESYKINDSIIGKTMVMGNRATTTNAQEYEAVVRFSDITYSGVYNEESNINKLNEFNAGLLNFKACEQSFGPIMKMQARETDILVLQEDKISYVLSGKNLLSDAGGGSSLTSVPQVLGTQIARIEEYGISQNPESFSIYGAEKFFTDAKRGVVVKLLGAGGQQDRLEIISNEGMRPWFRDLFQVSFTSQKLGGYDPYMNEYVLSNNTIQLPADEIPINCGISKTISVTNTKSYTENFDVGNLVGNTDINFTVNSISSGATVTVSAVYNGVTVTTGPVTSGGTLSVNKNLVIEQDLQLLITTTGTVNITATVNCPIGDIITIKLIHLSSAVDTGLQIHDEYRWVDGAFVSPLHQEQVIFASGNYPVVSLFETITGPQGGGVIPTNGAVVEMLSNKINNDDFIFNINEDTFQYLRSNTLYNNNAADIASLLALVTTATPNVAPTNGNSAFSADFIMPSSGQYLYLVWDTRTSTPLDLCFGTTAVLACCGCTGSTPNNIYLLEDCETGLSWKVEDTYGVFTIGDVVQYKTGLGANQGTIINCGEIISIGTTPNATLFSAVTRVCGDTVNCGVSPTNCVLYQTATTSGSGITYTYTDCDGIARTDSVGGASGFDSNDFCAEEGTVVGAPNLVNQGDCPF